MNRRLLAALLSVIAVVASVLVAAPASATIRVSHGASYSGVSADGDPVMAISANGEKVVAVSTPREANGCPSNTAAFVLKGGFANSDGTTWEDHNEWLEAIPGAPCSYASDVQVVLSDDGTSGLIVWTAFDFDSQSNQIRFARIDWSEGSFPTVTSNTLGFAGGAWGYPNLNPMKSAALSLDGSRAVIAWARNVVNPQNVVASTSTVSYSVIDMNNPSAATEQAMPGGTYPGTTFAPDVAISSDGSIVMMSRPGSPNQTSTSTFRIARVFTCSHNCYPNRLKRFEATVPVASGGYNLEARMNLAGDRIAVAWANAGSARKPVVGVFNPNALVSSASVIDITSKIKQVAATSARELDFVFAMNESGTKLAYLGRGDDRVQVVTANIASNLGLTSVATVDMYPNPVQKIDRLEFLNATAAAAGSLATPERLAVVTPDATDYQANGISTVFKVLVSDSSSKPTNWAEVFSTSVPAMSWFTRYGFAMARSSSRFVASAGKTLVSGQSYSFESSAVVDVAKNVLSVSTKPALTGTGTYNKALTLGLGKWTTGASLAYTWKRGGFVLDPQPAGLKYTPLADDDMGVRMSATVTASKSGYYDTVISPAESPIMNGKPIRPVLQISGVTGPNDAPAVGNTLFPSRTGTFPETGITVVSLTWKVGNRVVGTAGTYIVQAGDVGKKISLTVKLTCPNWANATISKTTAVVIPAGR